MAKDLWNLAKHLAMLVLLVVALWNGWMFFFGDGSGFENSALALLLMNWLSADEMMDKLLNATGLLGK